MRPQRQQNVAGGTEDEARIRAIPLEMVEAWNRSSGDAFAEPFSETADFVAFEGTHLKGRNEITGFHQQIFDTVVKGTRLNGAVKFVRFLRPDLAIMHAVGGTTLQSGVDPSPSRESMQIFVVEKKHGEWRVEAVLNARRLTLEQQFFADDFEALPAPAQREVRELIASLKQRHGLRPRGER